MSHQQEQGKILQSTGHSRVLLKHPQALGREGAASLEGTECGDFCQDTSWLSWLPGDRDGTALPGDPQRDEEWVLPPQHPDPRPGFSVRLNSSWFPAGAGTELSPLPSPQGSQLPASHPSLWDISFQTSHISSVGACVPSRRNKR